MKNGQLTAKSKSEAEAVLHAGERLVCDADLLESVVPPVT
jgi:hypothetical protein